METNLVQAINRGDIQKSKEIISQLKQELSWETVYGYNFMEKDPEGNHLRFEDYKYLLEDDYAYTPFKLKDASVASYDHSKHPDATGGVKGKDNIDSGAKFIVLDVDTSTITDEEAHFLLEGTNHHIARTSDPDNAFKFRVLVEMDMIVNLDSIAWKHFIKLVGSKLGLNIDPVAQSQIFYSYKGREVMSEVSGSPLAVKDLIVRALEAKDLKTPAKAIGVAQKKSLLDNPMVTFQHAFEHDTETGVSSAMIQAAYYARDLGATKEYIIELMNKIQKYVDFPLKEDRFENTIISQIQRWN